MLHKNRSRSTGLWKYGFSAPLFMVMLIVSAATASAERNTLSVDAAESIDPIREISSMDLLPDKNGDRQEQKVNSVNNVVDEIALKKHIQRNIKYPATARQNEITGYVVVNFTVADSKITKTTIAKGLQGDIDADVLRVFSLFTDPVELANKDYSLAIYYQLTGVHTADVLPAVSNTYLGQIVVTGMGPNENKATIYQMREVVINNPSGQPVKDFSAVQTLPEFAGGLGEWAEYLKQNLKYPDLAKKNMVQGRVILAFVVLKDGSITDIKVLRGLGSGLDEEAVRVVAQSPKWKPGIADGQPVNVAYTMPIFFQLGPQTATTAPNVNPKRTLPADVADFATIEVHPEFPGGMAGWGKYLQANLKYPEAAKKEKLTGRVILRFIVEKDGSLSDIQVLRGIGGGADEEAIRVLKSAPNWKPGIQEGRPVRVAYTMPISFQTTSN